MRPWRVSTTTKDSLGACGNLWLRAKTLIYFRISAFTYKLLSLPIIEHERRWKKRGQRKVERYLYMPKAIYIKCTKRKEIFIKNKMLKKIFINGILYIRGRGQEDGTRYRGNQGRAYRIVSGS